MKKIIKCCVHCHQSFIPQRNPQQSYCAEQACQNARKRDWRKQKRASDPDYLQNQQRTNQRWQQRAPAYWRQYREAHPNYAKRNRDQSRLRKQKQRLLQADHSPLGNASPFARFATGDALPDANSLQDAVIPGIYRLMPATHPGFAKSDALLVTIAVVAGV